MKRPIKEEYHEVYYYVTDLQKYCDELEKENNRLSNQLVELSRVCKSKDERIEELTSNRYEVKDDV